MRDLGFTKSWFIFLVACSVLGSCAYQKQNKERKIIGTWQVINVINPEADTLLEQWIFTGSGRCTIVTIGVDTTIQDEGEWSILQKLDRAYVNTVFEGEYASSFGYNNLWRIKKLDKDALYITYKEGGLLTKEFEKL